MNIYLSITMAVLLLGVLLILRSLVGVLLDVRAGIAKLHLYIENGFALGVLQRLEEITEYTGRVDVTTRRLDHAASCIEDHLSRTPEEQAAWRRMVEQSRPGKRIQ